MRYGIPLPQTPTAQEGSLDKSGQNRRLALDRLARIDDQYRLEGSPQVPRVTWIRPQLPDEAGQARQVYHAGTRRDDPGDPRHHPGADAGAVGAT